MKVEIAKRADGSGVLSGTRRDGSVTWQKQAKHGGFFALHDLTHFAVETALAYRHGFFGLIEEGWDVDDTTGKGPRGPLPDEAREVERMVGVFDSERMTGTLLSTEDFNRFAPRPLTTEEIQTVRALRSDLFERWFSLLVGEKLVLDYSAKNASTAVLKPGRTSEVRESPPRRFDTNPSPSGPRR
jgi:hypothetical protein